MESTFRSKKDNKKKHPERDLAIAKRKREEAGSRNEAWKAKPPKEQLAYLEATFPNGASKQKEKVRRRLDKEAAAAPKVPSCIPELTEAVQKKRAKERRQEERDRRRSRSEEGVS
jgi:hypothetical protein